MKVTETTGFILNVTARKILQLISFQFSQYDVTPEQWTLLNLLEEQDGITQKELAQRSEKDPANVTRILDQLERKGWIRRAPNEGDRRSFLTYITAEGSALNEKLIPIAAEVTSIAFDGISEEKLTLLRETLKEITENIDRHSNK